jgi:hypothetical protein
MVLFPLFARFRLASRQLSFQNSSSVVWEKITFWRRDLNYSSRNGFLGPVIEVDLVWKLEVKEATLVILNAVLFHADILNSQSTCDKKCKEPWTSAGYMQVTGLERADNASDCLTRVTILWWMMQQGVDTCKGDGGSPHICKKNGKAGWFLNFF